VGEKKREGDHLEGRKEGRKEGKKEGRKREMVNSTKMEEEKEDWSHEKQIQCRPEAMGQQGKAKEHISEALIRSHLSGSFWAFSMFFRPKHCTRLR
jgi:hypothetical protein